MDSGCLARCHARCSSFPFLGTVEGVLARLQPQVLLEARRLRHHPHYPTHQPTHPSERWGPLRDPLSGGDRYVTL